MEDLELRPTDLERAATFAIEKHEGQMRKFTGLPYWSHLSQVASLVRIANLGKKVEMAAWLHDVCEDCNVSNEEIAEKFGLGVATLVYWVTDPPRNDMPRKEWKVAIRRKYKEAPFTARMLKCADMISNLSSLAETTPDPKYAMSYLSECFALYKVIVGEGDKHCILARMLSRLITDQQKKLLMRA